MKVQKLIGDMMEKKQIPPYALFWWAFNISASLAAQFNPKVLSFFKLITDEMYKEHYGEAVVRLGLVKPEKSTESQSDESKEEVKDVLPSESESNRQEPDVPETTSERRIFLLD